MVLFKIIKTYFYKERINLQIHYFLLCVGGYTLALIREKIPIVQIDFFSFFLSILAIILAFYSSLVFNDIYDFEGDRRNSKRTPLTLNLVEKKSYFRYGLLFMFISLFFSILINIYSFVNLLVLHFLQVIYSFPPIRLKRVYPVSIIILSLAALFTVLYGFSVIEEKYYLKNFPVKLYLVFLLAFPFAMNFRDVLDLEGDKIQNIKTLAVLAGEKKAPLFAGISLLITYLLVAIILSKPVFYLLSSILGSLSLVLSLRKKFEETPLFLIYFFYLTLSIVIILFNPHYLF
ncbi:MAG: UbiA family prenyltransferase [Candidatus Hydrothermales bacterium]